MLEHGELKMQFDLGPVSCLQDGREVKQGIRRNFARRARSYDRHAGMQRLMAQSLAAAVGERLAQARRILEIGCGTGYLTSLLRQANREARLVALDLDAALVAAARRRLGPGAGVAWLVADGETPIRGEYDLIIANATFQWFTHPGETLAALYRNLAPGGVLAFSTLGPRTFQELAEALNRAARSLNLAAAPTDPGPGVWRPGDLGPPPLSGRLPPGAAGPGNGHRHLPLGKRVSQSPPGHGGHQPPALPLVPRLLTGLIEAYQTSYGRDGAIPVSYEMIWAVAEKS